MREQMFCQQCQKAAGNIGCKVVGVCGKQAHTAALQDVLMYVSKALASVAVERKNKDENTKQVNKQLINQLINQYNTVMVAIRKEKIKMKTIMFQIMIATVIFHRPNNFWISKKS